MSIYNNDWLTGRHEPGHSPKFLFFWGHRPAKDGLPSASCFSQWWVAPFVVEGISYPSAEHWMMGEKARLFQDSTALHAILQADSPAEAKKIGRTVAGFDPDAWNAHKYKAVKTGNLHKFQQHPDLHDFLLSTGDRVLVEASPVDPIWGIGLAADHPDALHPSRWRGENLLGYALMEVRDLLRNQSQTS